MISTPQSKPVFGFILFGGGLSGALIRDVRLANELADRGFQVHVWWAMDWQCDANLRDSIRQHYLFHGARYFKQNGSTFYELIGRAMTAHWPENKRAKTIQKRPRLLQNLMGNLLQLVADGIENDPKVINRFTRDLDDSNVTHLLPMLSVLCPWALAASENLNHKVKYLVTFQGYELYVNYARIAGCEDAFYKQLRHVTEQSQYKAIAVSEDYLDRVVQDIGIPRKLLCAIPPGVPTRGAMKPDQATKLIQKHFIHYQPDLPLITYLGRQDVEKGIDLLLYAASILRRQGLKFQLAIAGPSLFGNIYSKVIHQIAKDLRCDVIFSDHVTDELRHALFSASRCVVYPSIHREPFGMVPVEAQACSTPAIVPDYGGVAGTIKANNNPGGLHFNAWDSGDLAKKIAMLIEDDSLYQQLSNNGPAIADYYSIANLANRVLSHMNLA